MIAMGGSMTNPPGKRIHVPVLLGEVLTRSIVAASAAIAAFGLVCLAAGGGVVALCLAIVGLLSLSIVQRARINSNGPAIACTSSRPGSPASASSPSGFTPGPST